MSERKFYKTILTFAVLSEDKPISTCSLDEFKEVIEDCDLGSCVGRMLKEEAISLTAEQMRQALLSFGSEPGFFDTEHEEHAKGDT